MKNPAIQINGEDYSHFKRFEMEDAKAPSYLKKKVETGPFKSIDLKLLLNESLMFANSEDYTGLQLVDILCNCLRRACNGNLAEHAWRNLGKLTLTAKNGSSSVRLLSFNTKEESLVSYAGAIKLMNIQAKPLVLKK